MSRKRNRNAITLEQQIERALEAVIARRFTNPTGATVTPISQSVLNTMQAQMAPQDKTQGMFSPGAPIRPVPGITPAQGPRQWSYQVGYNIGSLPRSTEMTSFDTLRNLAMLYDGIGMCEQVWFDLCSKLILEIKPKPELTTDDQGDPLPPEQIEARYGARIAAWKTKFQKPDGKRSLKRWLRMALRDRLEIDALSIFKHGARGGDLYALEVIDGATIKPLLDERGMEPEPPYPAYQQFVYGVPGMLLLNNQLIYRRETERTDSPYGISRVERIILRVNQALRKENRDLATFTDGNMPAGTLEPPDDGTTDWTPEQLLVYQQMWDGLLAGNDAIKARIKVIPPGAKFNKTDADDIMTPFDTFLLNVTVAAFGLTMAELGFTENVNKSSGDTQEAVVYRRAMAPIMDDFAEMFTEIMAEYDGNDDLMAAWKGYEEPEDFQAKVTAWNILTTSGIQSTSQAATALGLKAMIETEPFVMTKDGPFFLADAMDPAIRKAQKASQLAGLQFSAQNPGGPPQDDDSAQSEDEGKKGSPKGKARGDSGAAGKDGGSGPHRAAVVAGDDGLSAVADHRTAGGDAKASADLRKWRDVALKRVADGKPQRSFISLDIPPEQVVRIFDALQEVQTADEVHALFRAEKASLIAWEPPDVEQQLSSIERAGVATITWDADQYACGEICMPNDGKTVKVGQPFPGGQRTVNGHPNCLCKPVYRDASGNVVTLASNRSAPVSKMGTCECEVCQERAGKPITSERKPPFHEGCDCRVEGVPG